MEVTEVVIFPLSQWLQCVAGKTSVPFIFVCFYVVVFMCNMTNSFKHLEGSRYHNFLTGGHKQRAKSLTALEISNDIDTDGHRCSQHHIHCCVLCPEEVLKERRRSFAPHTHLRPWLVTL